MLDIKFIRDNQKIVAKAIADKCVVADIARLLDVDKKRGALLQEIEQMHSMKNDINSIVKDVVDKRERAEAIAKGKEIKIKIETTKAELLEVQKTFDDIMESLPNIPSEDTPVGKDASENKVLRKWGDMPEQNFIPKEHWQLGADLNVIDTKRAAKISGARFAYLKGDLALLEFALVQFAFSVLTDAKQLGKIIADNNLSIPDRPFTPVIPPVLIRPEMMKRMARHDTEEMYFLERDELNLIGSAEHALGAMYADEVLDEKELPLRLVGFSTAFRREAGSYGKDTKGILRVHQFDKLEMESFTTAENSLDEQNFFVAIQEFFMQALKIPYQVVQICTGDMGKPDVRQIDIEAWLPGQKAYRETHTADLIGDFQARRLNTKVKRAQGKTELVHMNDATVFAMSRTPIAIMENYQQKDGSVAIPKVLQQYMPGKKAVIR